MTPPIIAEQMRKQRRRSDGGKYRRVGDQVFCTQVWRFSGNVCIAAHRLCHRPGGWTAVWRSLDHTGKAQHLLRDRSVTQPGICSMRQLPGCNLFLARLISRITTTPRFVTRFPNASRNCPGCADCLGPALQQRLGDYCSDNLGGLAGSFLFRHYARLDRHAQLHRGLPIDIRHITFSAANFAYALVALLDLRSALIRR